MKKESNTLNYMTILSIVFTVLKLTGQIDWSWAKVLSPMWLPIAILFGLTFIVGTIDAILKEMKKDE